MRKNVTDRILGETEIGYDLISDKFSQTRKNFWADLEFIRDYVKDGNKVLDFGCGNGRLFSFLNDKAEVEYWGVDVSGKLIEKANELNFGSGAQFSKIDPRQKSLAFEDGFFNSIYSIAVFHHIPSFEARLQIAKELSRIIKPGGYIVVTVWNLWQKKYFKNILENWKRKIQGKSELDWNDCYISFTDNQNNKFQRFHHAFTRWDLENLFEKAGFETQRCEVVGGRNIVYVGIKTIRKDGTKLGAVSGQG